MYTLADISTFESLGHSKGCYGLMVFNNEKKKNATYTFTQPIKGNIRVRYGKSSKGNDYTGYPDDLLDLISKWDKDGFVKDAKHYGFSKSMSYKNVPATMLGGILDDAKNDDVDFMDIEYGDGGPGNKWEYKRNADDPEDTVGRWREKLMEDPKFKRVFYESSMPDKTRKAYEQIPEEDRIAPDESDTYDSWVDKMGANPIFKRAEIIGMLPGVEAAIYDTNKNELPEIADDDTYDTWHKKLEDNETFRKLRLFSQLPEDKIRKIILRNLPEAEASDTVDTWLKKMDQ